MCEYMFRDKVEKMGLSSEFSVASRSLSTDYEPQGSPANEQGQLVRKYITRKIFYVYLIFRVLVGDVARVWNQYLRSPIQAPVRG